jgi:hypothetical protein
MTHKTKWLIFAPAGLVLVGAGASMVHWAGSLKDQGRPAREWLGAGTLALTVLNAGLSIFGQGVAEKVLHDLHEKPLEAEPGWEAGSIGLL